LKACRNSWKSQDGWDFQKFNTEGEQMKVRDALDRVHPADEHLLEIVDEEAFLESLDTEIRDLLAEVEFSNEVEFTYESASVRRCADCTEPAMTRKGDRGPHPRRCEFHTRARKKAQDAGASKPREPYPACCKEWQEDANPGHTGLCPQHEDHRDEIKEQLRRHDISKQEISWLLAQFGAAEEGDGEDTCQPDGWHVEGQPQPKGFTSGRGPDEGRTRPDVHHDDPFGFNPGFSWVYATGRARLN
jgi:hypothetical protein